MKKLLLNIRHSTTKIIIGLIVLFILFSVPLVFYNYKRIQQKNKQENIETIQSVIDNINIILDSFDINLNTAINDARTLSCHGLRNNLNKTIISGRWVRSFTVFHNGKLYCSSFFKLHQLHPDIFDKYTTSKLNLLPSNFVKPQIPIFTYYVKNDEWSAFAVAPASIFFIDFLSTNFPKHTYLIIDNKWLNLNSKALSKSKTNTSKLLFLKSNKYPFTIAFDYSLALSTQDIFSFVILGIMLFIPITLSFAYVFLTATKRDLSRAILNNNFIPYYQLIVSIKDWKWFGAEILVRWQHPIKGLLPPSQFIGLLEKTKLIIPMTKNIMKRVAFELCSNIEQLPKHFYISFNIHISHLESNDLVNDCKSFLACFPPDTIKMSLELLEGDFIEYSTHINEQLTELRNMGVHISIDDFGTGYSNLGYLQKYVIDHLKIDRSFVSKITDILSDTRIIDIIIRLSKKMKILIIAEGVETANQFFYLKKHRVELIQGFLFNIPSPLQETLVSISKPIKQIKKDHAT